MAIDGNWSIAMETPLGRRTAALELKSAGSVLTGTMSGDAGTTPIADGTVAGDRASWKASITSPMAMTLEFSATIDGDVMSGSVGLGMFGSAPLSGTRA